MEIYLDNSATTRTFPAVRETMVRTMAEDFGNPSSLHRKGVEAERYVRQAQEQIARSLKVDPKEILFTSGGTESNNLAILGTAMVASRIGRHLVTSSVEHPSVSEAMKYLEEQGYSVTWLPVDSQGRVSPEAVEAAVTPETILVSIMAVNNEIGTREPVEEMGPRIKARNPRCLFHVDAVQGFGKYRLRPRAAKIDLLSVSAHKIHGPKGIGFLYVRDGVRLHPILFGGGQQHGLRSGTENVPGIAGLGAAVEEIYRDHEARMDRLYACKARLTQGLRKLPDVQVNGPEGREGAPHIVSASFAGVRSEVLLHALEEKGIYVSAGSACSSHHPGVSSTLAAIGLDKKWLESTLRFSMSMDTTEEEIDTVLQALEGLLPFLRRFTRR